MTLALIFDLDGTLIDSVYQHIFAWRDGLNEQGADLPLWRIHHKIGKAGALVTKELLSEAGLAPTPARMKGLREAHGLAYQKRAVNVKPFPGSEALIECLRERGTPWAIATSSGRETADENLHILGIDRMNAIVVGREDAAFGKPEPDLVLAASKRLGVEPAQCSVIGDSVWDMVAAERSGASGIGVLCGGTARQALVNAGARMVCSGPLELRARLAQAESSAATRRPRKHSP
jgi:HAD superfamily hydrolase (TIGR01509 family)